METQVEGYENKRIIVLPTTHSPFYLPIEAARYLRICSRSLERHRVDKTGPDFRRHGGVVCYHEDDLKAWSLSQTEKI